MRPAVVRFLMNNRYDFLHTRGAGSLFPEGSSAPAPASQRTAVASRLCRRPFQVRFIRGDSVMLFRPVSMDSWSDSGRDRSTAQIPKIGSSASNMLIQEHRSLSPILNFD